MTKATATIAILLGLTLGTAYLVAKKRKNAQRGAMMALLALLAFGPTAWAQNGIYCTASDKNRVVCTDGTIYDNVAAATADGKTAPAKIIYIDESSKKGLALALKDEARNTQDGGITACNNKNTSMPVLGGTWKLASKSEWESMISAAGGSPTLHDGFSSVGGTNMNVDVYWSSEKNGSNGLLLQYSSGWSDFVSNSQYANIRACLTFNLLTLCEIGSQSEWNEFCTAVNTGSTLYGDTFSDKYVKLTSDISVSEMAGSSESNSFQGLFDGDGHTLTVSYNTEYAVTAPFRYVNNATIRNLKTTGTITTGGMCAAGIVGDVTGSLNLSSCSSSVAISSSRPQMDAHGGLVASNNGNVTISGCVFDGSFAATVAHTNSYGTTFCGGIVGMCNENTSATITNSLVAPSSVSEGMINETFVGLYEVATVTIENCYFVATANLPTNQGTQVYYTAPANEISKSITISGTTVYYACTVSGVEATYNLDSGLASVTPTLTDPSAATLTFGTDYTATLDGNAVQNFPVKISTAGNYTLVLTGAGSYTGTKTFNITATGDPVNSALIISSKAEWDTFAESVNKGNNYSNQFVKLTADISVSTMVGTSETNSFQGTFLGDGTHTLTFTKGTAESAFGEENCAPFRYVKNATIRDLKVTGDIYTSRKFAAGLVARNSGETNITNCQVGTVIHSSVSGDGTHGGIVAMPASNTTTNIEGCVFNGRLLTTSGTQNCGGFVGWSGNTTAIVTNSLYAPDANIAVAQGETAIDNGATFVRGNSPTIGTNCYYTATMGTAQGTQVYSITPDTGITIENAGIAGDAYNVSGLTFYTTGFKCGDAHYAASGNNVSLNLSCPTTATVNYQASNGTLSGNGNLYTLTMPAENVVISCNIVREIAGYGDSETNGWAFIASPVEGSIETSAVGNIFSATEYDLYRFNPSADLEWENWKQEGNHHHFNLESGQGYLYATKETKTLVFSGSFNTGDTKTIENLPQGFNLVGNPFTTDAYINKPYYTLNDDGSVIVAQPNGTTTPIAPCHGVIVEVDGNESVTFSKTAPAATANQGLLNITVAEQKADTRGASTGSATAIDNAIVRFGEGEQLGKFHFGNPSANISIPQGGKEYAVANVNVGTDVARNVSTNEMPVNFKATKDGEYTISFNPENVEFDYLHLIDNLTGADVDLLSAGDRGSAPAMTTEGVSYTFTAKTTDYASRFRLVFSASGDACEPSGNFAFISNGNIIVNGEGTLQVVDVTGRVVRCSDGVHTVSTNGMTPGIYVLRLIEGNNVRIQKIVIE